MTLVAWQTEFETGVRSVDFEHQEMVALLNRLHGELCRDPDSDSLEGFLGEVFANISAHFALEEKIMRDIAYDDYQPHKDNHEQLLDGIRDIMDHHYGGDYVGAPQLLADLLKDWFEEHFRGYDARLGHLTE
ncbi:MAG: hemerythrin family protein [Rhodospirillaceae bacterium]|jgi:hemerythrin|nr:hemerythrin family protein [Rhodospirillaceae bacterium]MBT4044295.1 hemerythrin family protein [Rhodospirillaceae bacterium]MBT4689448.1 hemerythrin family protein [Rhodospirillaceae bacterium]MBT5079168.1 hemerythrin family protein [Rhodospirillaceae bacterium]MBT5527466.1 hemerythrin family protein [Rhodospirillaceae bacterium]